MARSRPPAAGRQSRREEILTTALELYTKRGVAAITPADLGRATDMTSTAIRYHFPTTESLIHALTEPFLLAVHETINANPRQPAWPEGVEQLATDFINTVLDHRDVALLIHNDPTLGSHPDIGRRFDQATGRIRSAVTGPNPTSGEKVAAIAAVGGIWRPIKLLDIEDVRHHIDEILHVILSGHSQRE